VYGPSWPHAAFEHLICQISVLDLYQTCAQMSDSSSLFKLREFYEGGGFIRGNQLSDVAVRVVTLLRPRLHCKATQATWILSRSLCAPEEAWVIRASTEVLCNATQSGTNVNCISLQYRRTNYSNPCAVVTLPGAASRIRSYRTRTALILIINLH
jgi:hypothetical protein